MTPLYDCDVHALEPVGLWPSEWVDRWPEKLEMPLDSYLRHLDAEGCDVGLFIPTRALFMGGFDAGRYNEWAHDFCAKSGGRLAPTCWRPDGDTYPGSLEGLFVAWVMGPVAALAACQHEAGPIIVHSCTTMRYSQNFYVDQAVTHGLDAIRFLAELTHLPLPRCNLAIMEAGHRWYSDWVKKLNVSIALMDRIWISGEPRETVAGYPRQTIVGSDFPHFDATPISLNQYAKKYVCGSSVAAFIGGAL